MLNIDKNLYDEIKLYCKTNNIVDVESFCNRLIETGFNIEKYGNEPSFFKKSKKNVETTSLDEKNKLPSPTQTEIPEKTIKPNFKKANLNDDYKIYDNF